VYIKLNNKQIDFTTANWSELKKLNNSSQWWIDIIDFLLQFTNKSPNIELYTSGSSGTPKVISVKKTQMIASAKMTCKFFNLSNNSTGLLCLPAKYIAGKMMIVRAIVSKMNLICVEPSKNPIKYLTQKVDFTAITPYQADEILKTIDKLTLIKNIIIGGGKTPKLLINKLNKLPINIYETFGMTETLSHIALKQIAPKTQKQFTTLDDIEIEQGENNELIINANSLGVDKLVTTDVVELISNKEFIWKGRLDFIINSGGVKINPESIEAEIFAIIPNKFCIIGIPDVKLGEKVALVIESNPFDTSHLKKQLKSILHSYRQPKEIVFHAQFPLTQSGKIRIGVLKNILGF